MTLTVAYRYLLSKKHRYKTFLFLSEIGITT